MTLLEATPDAGGTTHVPVLETARLALRPATPADAEVIASLLNDRRIAEMTTRIPHPFKLADAGDFLATVNCEGGETAFAITARDGTFLGVCGIALRAGQPPEI